MESKQASITSLISAFGRAYHSENDTPKIFDDFIARELISENEYVDISENLIKGFPFFNRDSVQQGLQNRGEILKWVTQIHLSPTPLARAAYCEKVLLNEIMLGVHQYVILGAGLDTFCFRHPEFENRLKIFEVDSPSTQRDKKVRLRNAGLPVPPNLQFVSMDFTNGFSIQQLVQKGFKNKKTFFSLLGVSYYLTKQEFESLLNQIFLNVPIGSSIVFDYPDENLFEAKGMFNRVEGTVKMASATGEPMKSCFSYGELEKILEISGLLIYEHLSPDTINNRYYNDRTDYLTAFECIHFIHAVKR